MPALATLEARCAQVSNMLSMHIYTSFGKSRLVSHVSRALSVCNHVCLMHPLPKPGAKVQI